MRIFLFVMFSAENSCCFTFNFLKTLMKRILLLSTVLFWAVGAAWAQQTVTGTVTSGEDGSTLPSVAIQIKGTDKGVLTNIDGKYTIEVPSSESVLVYSFYGYADQEQTVGSRTTINVSMLQEDEVLDAVVVTALGFEVNKDKIGTSQSSVDGSKIANSGEATLLQGLAGKAAGLNITQNSGDPGAGSRIVIRGATSITGDLQPLIVIDGVPMFNDQVYGSGSNEVGSGGGVRTCKGIRLP